MASSNRAPIIKPMGIYTFRVIEEDVEKLMNSSSLTVLLHKPECQATTYKVWKRVYRLCQEPYYEIDLTGEEVFGLMFFQGSYMAKGLEAVEVELDHDSRYIYPSPSTNMPEGVLLLPHQCAVDWFLALVPRDEVKEHISLEWHVHKEKSGVEVEPRKGCNRNLYGFSRRSRNDTADVWIRNTNPNKEQILDDGGVKILYNDRAPKDLATRVQIVRNGYRTEAIGYLWGAKSFIEGRQPRTGLINFCLDHGHIPHVVAQDI
jgi:hypothetical protein